MRYLIAEKEYIYIYQQELYVNFRIIKSELDEKDMENIMKSLSYEIIAKGENLVTSIAECPEYTLEQFAKTFFDLRLNQKFRREDESTISENCELLESYLNKQELQQEEV